MMRLEGGEAFDHGVKCYVCRGSGLHYANGETCTRCHGYGAVPAKDCWCGGSTYFKWEVGDKTSFPTPRCLDSAYHDPNATGKPSEIRKLYLAGPMSGRPDCNYPAFNAAACVLRAHGYEVVNPAENGDLGSHYTHLLREDIRLLLDCDGVAVLEEWWESVGARAEVQIAGLLKMPVRTVIAWADEWFAPIPDAGK